MWQNDLDGFDSASDMDLGERYATEPAPSSTSLPERALLRAVLQEAILDVRGYATGMAGTDRQRAAQEAYCWIVSRNVTWPFSFENICAVLGFDADCLRQWLLRDAPPRGHAPAAGARAPIRGGGMVRAVRAARMRGNQQKHPLRLRRPGSAPGARRQAPLRARAQHDQ
jgi:hypothetical protein